MVRRRLLNMLPQEAGYVVCLEAPYGYGKSVLAMQWAERLEEEAWRVLWLSANGREIKPELANLLNLPTHVSWAGIHNELWHTKTALVIEDLEGDEDLSPLLKQVKGLLLLSSRMALSYPELLKLSTQGYTVHLQAQSLLFTLSEAQALFVDKEACRLAFERSKGWPLPLHFTSLTGGLPSQESLIKGIKDSLSLEAWQEALFMAALPYLPKDVASKATKVLVNAGFIQVLENGFRLHSYLADCIAESFLEDVQASVKQNAERLPLWFQGRAFERSGLLSELAELLSEEGEDLSRHDPEAVLRWDALAPKTTSITRAVRVGWSMWALGQRSEAVAFLLRAAAETKVSADEALLLYKDLVWVLSQHQQKDKAKEVIGLAKPHLKKATPEIAGRFLNNAFYTYLKVGDWVVAEETLQAALEKYPHDSPYKKISQGNLSIVRWHAKGDFATLLKEREAALESNRKLNPSNVPGDILQLAELHFLLGHRQKALTMLEEVPLWEKANYRWALEALALKAYLKKDHQAFIRLYTEAEHWEETELLDRTLFFWARTCREAGSPAPAALTNPQGNWGKIEKALFTLQDSGESALSWLGTGPEVDSSMELRLVWQAAHYQITKESSSLTKLCSLTLAGEKVLPALLALKDLPKDAPSLSEHYPIKDVLWSGWQEAVDYRLPDIPHLQVTALGRVSATLFGETLELTDKHKYLLALLLLGHDRDAIGEAMWPEVETKKMRNNLNVQFNALRKVLEPWQRTTFIQTSGLTRTQADLWKLNAALSQKDADTVLKLYKPFAKDIDIPLVNEVREVLALEVTHCLFEASQDAPAEKARLYLEKVLEVDPLYEVALQGLLKLLVQKGRRIEAQKRFRQFATHLEEELGIKPMPETHKVLTSAISAQA